MRDATAEFLRSTFGFLTTVCSQSPAALSQIPDSPSSDFGKAIYSGKYRGFVAIHALGVGCNFFHTCPPRDVFDVRCDVSHFP